MSSDQNSTSIQHPSQGQRLNISSTYETLTPSEIESLRQDAKETIDSARKAFSRLPKIRARGKAA